MAVRVTVIGDDAVLAALAEEARRAGDLSPLMADVAGVLMDRVEDSFEAEADPGTGFAWPVLAPSTAAARGASGHGTGKILQVTGQLAASYQSESGADYAQAGSGDIRAATHHFGDPDRHIPGRPALGVTPADEAEILEVARAFFARPFGRSAVDHPRPLR